jgi:DNA-directed RNA polymerase subunit alpha
MQNIALPKKIEFKPGASAQEGTVTVEPLFPGYGMTLGNSLRRVLLSSLPGAAVVGVKVKGASHEFMALPHVKEDVLEIVLNLKQLRLKIYTEEEVRLELKVKGKKTVTVGDIAKNSQAEVKNPGLVLAHITDDAGSLEMEIFVHEGRGYRMTEGTKRENREIGYIELDSVYSPVILVSISVENTRVGKMTNWDKLVLNIKTDGTISPEEAFNEAVKVLVDQYSSLLPSGGLGVDTSEAGVAEATSEATAMAEAPTEKKAKADKKEKVKKPKK